MLSRERVKAMAEVETVQGALRKRQGRLESLDSQEDLSNKRKELHVRETFCFCPFHCTAPYIIHISLEYA